MAYCMAVCDDDADILSVLTSAIQLAFSKHNASLTIDSFSSTDSLKKKMETKHYDVLFLDIDMPGTDGIAFGKLLREESSNSCIIYISNREERVFETFSVQPLDFIRKSHFHKEIDKTVNIVLNYLNTLAEQNQV